VDEDIRAMVPLGKSAPSELAVRPAEQVAADVMKVLDFIAERLRLQTPHPSTAKRVRGARTVPREFVVSMIASAEGKPHLRIIGDFDSAGAREAMESVDTCKLLSERMNLFLANLRYTSEARWAEVAAEAMQTFSLASIIAEDPKEAELAAEVENLRRQLGRKGTPKKKKRTA
jgi:hypothetical protein